MALIILLLGFIAILIFMYKMDTTYITELLKENTMNPLFPPYVPEDSYLTGSEKQQLSSLLKVQLFNAEMQRNRMLEHARKFKADGDKEAATAYYEGAEDCTQFIKKFGALQSKVKHSLYTRG